MPRFNPHPASLSYTPGGKQLPLQLLLDTCTAWTLQPWSTQYCKPRYIHTSTRLGTIRIRRESVCMCVLWWAYMKLCGPGVQLSLVSLLSNLLGLCYIYSYRDTIETYSLVYYLKWIQIRIQTRWIKGLQSGLIAFTRSWIQIQIYIDKYWLNHVRIWSLLDLKFVCNK